MTININDVISLIYLTSEERIVTVAANVSKTTSKNSHVTHSKIKNVIWVYFVFILGIPIRPLSRYL